MWQGEKGWIKAAVKVLETVCGNQQNHRQCGKSFWSSSLEGRSHRIQPVVTPTPIPAVYRAFGIFCSCRCCCPDGECLITISCGSYWDRAAAVPCAELDWEGHRGTLSLQHLRPDREKSLRPKTPWDRESAVTIYKYHIPYAAKCWYKLHDRSNRSKLTSVKDDEADPVLYPVRVTVKWWSAQLSSTEQTSKRNGNEIHSTWRIKYN